MASAATLKIQVAPSFLGRRNPDSAEIWISRPSFVVAASGSHNGSLRTEANPVQLKVAFQGSPGAYSDFAARLAFPGCSTSPCRTLRDAVSAVVGSVADCAIIPVESTVSGDTLLNYDLLLLHDLRIVREITLFVDYCLLAMPGVRSEELRRVISHPLALAHCGRAISRLGLRGEEVEDTAGAVEMLRSSRLLDTAAIASSRAALLYGLDVLANGLQDESWNVARFLAVSRRRSDPPPPSSPALMKTSLVVAYRGWSMSMLLKVLSSISSRGINLTKLEVYNPAMEEGKGSVFLLDVRPPATLRSFPHVLYVDLEGSEDNPAVKDAIEDISASAVFVRVLGCYPADSNVYDLH